MFTDRSLDSVCGCFTGYGEMRIFSLGFFNSMNSLKLIVIFSVVTFNAESLGEALTNTGGKLSLGPPPGGTILAQPAIFIIMVGMQRIRMIAGNNRFMYSATSITKCKHNFFHRILFRVYPNNPINHGSVSSSSNSCNETAILFVFTKLHQWQSSLPQPM
jgi:hypothetical protein